MAPAGCGRADGDSAPRRLERNGISIAIPNGWDGRVLFSEPSGRHGVVYQVASFSLPPNEGLDPPRTLPPGVEDPIKAMTEGDVLVTITDGGGRGLQAPEPITVTQLEAVAGPRVPRGHSLAAGSFCFGRRCLTVEVDFGSASPLKADVHAVDAALASLAVEV